MSWTSELWDGMFSKSPSASDLKMQLKQIERDQKKKRRDLDVKSGEKEEKLQEALEAKKKGKQEIVRDIFREMRQTELDINYIGKDLRRLSLAKMALSSFVRKMETLEQHKDRKGTVKLIESFHKDPKLLAAIDKAEVDDDAFNDILRDVLGEEEDAVVRGAREKDDAGFDEFDRALDDMLTGAAPDVEKVNKALQGEPAPRRKSASLDDD